MLERLPPLRRLLRDLLLALAIFGVVGYAVFEARRLIEGPEIIVETPADGSAIGGPAVTISGFAHNVAFLSINGKQAFVDERGRFTETLAPHSGYTVMTVSGKDRFGRSTAKFVHFTLINYCQAAPAA